MTRGGRRVRVLDRACDVGRDAERRAEQEALRASEERFRYATGAARGMTYEVSYPSWGAQLFGRETLLGYRSGQIGSNRERWLGLLHPEERRRFLAARPLRRIGFVQAGHDAAGEDPGLPAERDETLSLPAFWRTSNAGALMAAQPEDAAPIAAALIAWHERHGRHDLPWQREPTPYRVWVSEIMLQQTQVATVIGYYERFLRRFPDAAALAAAPLDEVLHLWSGLGYYSRARNLQRAAQCIVREHGGELPADPAALARLPGIGRSTAAAIAALAHGRRAAILDGNARRVLARYFAIEGPSTRRATQQELWRRAEQCTPAAAVAQYTQAIMDLGATLCTRRRPACTQCPLRAGCAAHRLEYDEEMVTYLIDEHYRKQGRSLHGCHPRDLLDHLVHGATYFGIQPELSRELLDHAASAYFADLTDEDY